MTAFQSDEFRRGRNLSFVADQRRSRLALGALICSLIAFVPLLPIVGAILGLAAWRTISKSSVATGKPLAIAAVALGAVFFAGQLAVGFTALGFQERTNHGPQRALAAGFAGNTSTFVNAFHQTKAPMHDADASNFVTVLRQRYGDFINGHILQPVASYQVVGASNQRHLYQLFFQNRSVMAEAAVVVFDDQGLSWPSNRLSYLKVSDPEAGDLIFPAPTQLARK